MAALIFSPLIRSNESLGKGGKEWRLGEHQRHHHHLSVLLYLQVLCIVTHSVLCIAMSVEVSYRWQ
jgi:hypothetical protein